MLRLKKVISSQTRMPFSTMSAMSFFSSSHATKDFLNSSGPKESTIYQGQGKLFTTFLPAIGAKADEVEIPLQVVEQPLLQHHLLLPARCIHLGLHANFKGRHYISHVSRHKGSLGKPQQRFSTVWGIPPQGISVASKRLWNLDHIPRNCELSYNLIGGVFKFQNH